MISPSFITHAANVLGETQTGLSGAKIVEYFNAYAVKYGKNVPYSAYPFPKGTPNKRTALAENLRIFEPKEQFQIIKELCGLPLFKDNLAAIDLHIKLISQYAQYSTKQNIVPLMENTEHWLSIYPDAYKPYKSALEKRELGIYSRNLLDDLRFSLEKLLNNILNNDKTLENQKSDLGSFLQNRGITPELRNLFNTIIFDRFCRYQNNNVKHNDGFEEKEVDFLIEQTTLLMKYLVQYSK